ncbi:hypothetical protein AB0L40_15675 [Patulibacter sp. NPDC049589]|uniref:hypothetical protein n=1 Tax=Patulibacter sp. NPDC049589 TaxID=3154731 RepID=UPI003440530F
MLEHDLWSPGLLTVRTTRHRRDGHAAEVLRDGRRVAEVDDGGFVRATTGLVLAEAPLGPGTAHAAVLAVEVFGVPRGEVRARSAADSWRRRRLDAELVVGGDVVALLRTTGRWGEEAVVVAGTAELATLARFDHLRGVRRTVSAWDLEVAEIPDERLRAVTIAALLRLGTLRAAAAARRPRG